MSHPPTSASSSRSLFSFFLDVKEVFTNHKREMTCLSFIAALILFSYSVARGPSESLFLQHHDQALLPGLWIEMGLAAMLLVVVYNRMLNHFSLYHVFNISFALTAMLFTILLSDSMHIEESTFNVLGQDFPIGSTTLLRIWCDLYIVLLVETFWSLSNLHFNLKSATLIYGFLGMAGSLGSMAGNFLTAVYAQDLGTKYLISLAVPCAILMSICSWPLRDSFKQLEKKHDHDQTQSSFLDGLKVVFSSRYLPLILLLVLSSQIAVTLIDYQYKGLLQTLFTDVNDRSAVQGWVYLSIDIGAIVMQALTGLTITLLGVGATLNLIPLLLLICCSIPLFTPLFMMIALGKSASKFFTYSIFKSAKELIYLPLSYAEQTQGKAIIDIMVYRQAKLVASVILITLSAQQVSPHTSGLYTVGAILIWLIISLLLWSRIRHDQDKLGT